MANPAFRDERPIQTRHAPGSSINNPNSAEGGFVQNAGPTGYPRPSHPGSGAYSTGPSNGAFQQSPREQRHPQDERAHPQRQQPRPYHAAPSSGGGRPPPAGRVASDGGLPQGARRYVSSSDSGPPSPRRPHTARDASYSPARPMMNGQSVASQGPLRQCLGSPFAHYNTPLLLRSADFLAKDNVAPPRQQQAAAGGHGQRPTSPELRSWDNPFPVFPGVKAKQARAAETRNVSGMLSEMSIRGAPRPAMPPAAAPSMDSGSRSNSLPSKLHNPAGTKTQPQERQHNGRPKDVRQASLAPKQPPQALNQAAQGPLAAALERRNDGQSGLLPLPKLDTAPTLSNQPWVSRPGTPNAEPSQSNAPESQQQISTSGPPTGAYAEMPGDLPRRHDSGPSMADSGPASVMHPGSQPMQPAAAYSQRPSTAPQPQSEEAAAAAAREPYPDSSRTAMSAAPAPNHHHSLGAFLETYYESSPHYHEHPINDDALDYDMPNFDAMPATTTSASHGRGMSIYQHLPQMEDDALQSDDETRANTRFNMGQYHPTDYAAQVPRGDSQPGLREGVGGVMTSQHAAAVPGPVGYAVERTGSVPPQPAHSSTQQQQQQQNFAATDMYRPMRYGNGEQQRQVNGSDHFPQDGRQAAMMPLPPSAAYSHFSSPYPAPSSSTGSGNNRHDQLPNGLPAHDSARPSSESGGHHPHQPPPAAAAAARPPNPDALPAHPTPVRYGLASSTPVNPPASNQPSHPPPPMRQYNSNGSSPHTHPMSAPPFPPPPAAGGDGSGAGDRRRSVAVTIAEVQRLQQAAKAKPSDQATQLQLAKKMAEAADLLAAAAADDHTSNTGKNRHARAAARSSSSSASSSLSSASPAASSLLSDPKARGKLRDKFAADALKTVKRLVHAGGSTDATFYLADCYGMGRLGLDVDAREAYSLYQAAAKAGHAAAAYRVAVCCEMGHEGGGGTRRDALKAIQWYKRAAGLGDTPAMYKMGIILLKGLLGQQRNPHEAVVWLKRAAERADEDNPHALHELVRSLSSFFSLTFSPPPFLPSVTPLRLSCFFSPYPTGDIIAQHTHPNTPTPPPPPSGSRTKGRNSHEESA